MNLTRFTRSRFAPCLLALLFGLTVSARAATVSIYTNDFEAYTSVATNLADTADADPTSSEWFVIDDNALSPSTTGAGIQVINWLTNSSGGANQALLIRPNSEAQIHFSNARSGSQYQFDFRALIARGPTSDRSFYVILRGEGADYNGQDFIAYRTDRITNSSALNLFDGVRSSPNWLLIGTNHANDQWQHHRLIIDTRTQMVSVYVDDMVNPIVSTGRVARSEIPMPTMMRIVNEANSADDGYWVIDDVSLTVDGSIGLATTFTEGFESYTARTDPADDADPLGPWITVENDGAADGGGRPLAPGKVQVVDSSVVTPHSGTKCLKLEGGQRAGSTVAWGVPPLSDVQVTWWARVPSSVQGQQANYLRMSLYGLEGGNSFSGDSALLGYGSRDATIGDATSITYFTTAWVDSGVDYTPDTWEEYRLITHNSQGKYTIIKNPSSVNSQVIVDRAPMIGAAANWGPTFIAAWSTSNGTNHPPVYVDDIEIKSLVSNPNPLPEPYTVNVSGNRLTNVTVLTVPGPVGKAAIDPRDNSTIIFALDGAPGGIYRAPKIASGNWAFDPVPIVSGLDRPSGLTVGPDGTIWWTHDFTMSLRRLKAPWNSNTVEDVIIDFGVAGTDDDPIDVTIAPTSFTGSMGQPNQVVIADRGTDTDPFNAIYLVDPSTTSLNQSNYNNLLAGPSTTDLGGGNLNAITSLRQSGEVVTISTDGFLVAVDGNGTRRTIIPNILWTNFISGGPAPAANAIAADPVTGRLWVADDLIDEIWSIDSNPSQTSDQLEVSFPLTNPSRTDLQIDFHDPGMNFSTNGAYLVISDTSTANGGGRLIILHNEAKIIPSFAITSSARVGNSFQLSWQSAGAVKYRVQRGTNFTSFADISADLTTTQFTDTNITGTAFYRVIAKP
jgi:hypothetical protein